MVDTSSNSGSVDGRKATVLLVSAALALVAFTTVANFTVGLNWFVAFASVGTAAGTLGLALYTYQLATSTRESISTSTRLTELAYDQLNAVRAQGELLADQAHKAGVQADATTRLADASSASAIEAARSRIDAISPLVDLRVTHLRTNVRETKSLNREEIGIAQKWYEPQLRDWIFEVIVDFRFQNVGASPAQLAFGDTSSALETVSMAGMYSVTLKPGDSYRDRLIVRFVGEEAKQGRLVRIPVTYGGLLSGEMHDHLQWNGWVTPLVLTDGVAVANNQNRVVSSAGPQVVRSYPNLEHPEMMAEARAHLLNPGGE